jgi:hypothetical protein
MYVVVSSLCIDNQQSLISPLVINSSAAPTPATLLHIRSTRHSYGEARSLSQSSVWRCVARRDQEIY